MDPLNAAFDTTPSNHQHHRHAFAHAKAQCLGKRDKSSAGRVDPHAVDVCAVINAHDAYYTTSSCAGRCFLYRGIGNKASSSSSGGIKTTTSSSSPSFQRFRVSHDCIPDAARYFNLTTLDTDPTGGGDPIPTIGQYEHAALIQREEEEESVVTATSDAANHPTTPTQSTATSVDKSIWLRFEPFILHVACRSLTAAGALMNAARPSFKNVGVTSWKQSKQQNHSHKNSNPIHSHNERYLVAIWGDEGLDMPLTTPDGVPLFSEHAGWLQLLVNDRHVRNWRKIDRLVEAVRKMELEDHDEGDEDAYAEDEGSVQRPRIPRSFDVIGDIALLHSLPDPNATDEERAQIGQAILQKNKAIKVVVVREGNLMGTERSPNHLTRLVGPSRSPLITTHNEYGIKCVVNLEATFFSPRMAAERLRLCQQVARGEYVLVLFAGVAMEALQLAGRTEAVSVLAVELNEAAVQCARLSHRMVARNKAVPCVGAAERLEIRQGDVLEILPTLPRNHFDRIVAPRPKEAGQVDGDLATEGKGGGWAFLEALLPVLKQNGGECHWYDFVADHEFPTCERSRNVLTRACAEQGLRMEVLHVANAGSVAMRQLRVCIDFKVFPLKYAISNSTCLDQNYLQPI